MNEDHAADLGVLLSRLAAAGHGHIARTVRIGARHEAIPFTVEILRGVAHVRVERGVLVAVIEEEGAKPVVVRATSDRAAGDAYPRRSVRVSDLKWAQLAKYGPPSSVAQEAIDEYLARKAASEG